jgi:hypothetical protein
MKQEPRTLNTANGEQLRVVGWTTIHVLDHPFRVMVVDDSLSEDIILGADALGQGQALMDFPSSSMHWLNRRWDLHTDRTGSSSTARVHAIDPPEITLPSTEHPALSAVLQEHKHVFGDIGEPPNPRLVTPMHLEVRGPPIAMKPYRLDLLKRQEVEQQVEELLEKGIISHSNSPYSAPITMVKKKDGSWRLCVDYRRLNAQMVRDQHPIPQIADILDSLGGKSLLDAGSKERVPPDPHRGERQTEDRLQLPPGAVPLQPRALRPS